MTNFFLLPAAAPARALRPCSLALLLALLPLLAHAATPVLRLEATVVAGDVTAFRGPGGNHRRHHRPTRGQRP